MATTSAGGIGDFALSLIFYLIMPLVPLFLEFWINGILSSSTLMITASLYTITIGISSSWKFLFGTGILSSVLTSSAYGVLLSSNEELSGTFAIPICIISFFFLSHTVERFRMHVKNNESLLRL